MRETKNNTKALEKDVVVEGINQPTDPASTVK